MLVFVIIWIKIFKINNVVKFKYRVKWIVFFRLCLFKKDWKGYMFKLCYYYVLYVILILGLLICDIENVW